jgi:RNA polymerase sigma-70 factor (ECF subfamily)
MSKHTSSIQHIALNFIENKNNENFSLLIDRLKPGLLSYAYKFVKDIDSANEVVSLAFVSMWEKSHQYKKEFGFSTWAYKITKNIALGMLKDKKRNLSYDKHIENHSRLLQMYNPVFNINIECMLPTGEDLTRELYDASISAIDNLKEPYKTVMVEREINQKQLNDIAEDLGWNLSTVKTRLRKGRKDVAEILYKKYPDLIDSYFENETEE